MILIFLVYLLTPTFICFPKVSRFYAVLVNNFGVDLCMPMNGSGTRTLIVTSTRGWCSYNCLYLGCLVFSYNSSSGYCVLANTFGETLTASNNGCKSYTRGTSKTETTGIPPPNDKFIYIPNFCNNPFTQLNGYQAVQRRCSGAVDFYRRWTDYQNGFGDLGGEFWIGNEMLHNMTNSATRQLRVDIQTSTGIKVFANYSTFKVGSNSTNYKLTIAGYAGNAGDAFNYCNNCIFSTYDVNNKNNCSVRRHTGNWMQSCLYANPNGLYGSNAVEGGVNWYHYQNCNTCSYPYFQMSVI